MNFEVLVLATNGEVSIHKVYGSNLIDALLRLAQKMSLPIPTRIAGDLYEAGGVGMMIKESAS